jgi:hypothetical protein
MWLHPCSLALQLPANCYHKVIIYKEKSSEKPLPMKTRRLIWLASNAFSYLHTVTTPHRISRNEMCDCG